MLPGYSLTRKAVYRKLHQTGSWQWETKMARASPLRVLSCQRKKICTTLRTSFSTWMDTKALRCLKCTTLSKWRPSLKSSSHQSRKLVLKTWSEGLLGQSAIMQRKLSPQSWTPDNQLLALQQRKQKTRSRQQWPNQTSLSEPITSFYLIFQDLSHPIYCIEATANSLR